MEAKPSCSKNVKQMQKKLEGKAVPAELGQSKDENKMTGQNAATFVPPQVWPDGEQSNDQTKTPRVVPFRGAYVRSSVVVHPRVVPPPRPVIVGARPPAAFVEPNQFRVIMPELLCLSGHQPVQRPPCPPSPSSPEKKRKLM